MQEQFKVGDKVRVVRCKGDIQAHVGRIGAIDLILSTGEYVIPREVGYDPCCAAEVERVIDTPLSHQNCGPMTNRVSVSPGSYRITAGHIITLENIGVASEHIKNSIGGTLMSGLSLIAKKTFDKDTRTLIAAGVLDSDLNVCDHQLVLAFIVNQYMAELAALAQEQLDEAQATKGK